MNNTRTRPGSIDPDLLATDLQWSNTLESPLNDGFNPSVNIRTGSSAFPSTRTTAQGGEGTNYLMPVSRPTVQTRSVQTPSVRACEGAMKVNLVNMSRPINQLPHEILHYIFRLCALGERKPQESKGRTRWTQTTTQPRWDTAWIFEITHTCRHWRNIALDDPGLWTCILDFQNQTLTKVMVSRSKRCPLTIHVHITHEMCENGAARTLLTRLAAYRERIQSLVFSGFPIPESLWATLLSETTAPSHSIDPSCLSIDEIKNDVVSSVVGLPGLRSITATADFPATFHVDELGNDSRNIRVLRLRGYNLPWTIQSMTHLTELTHLHIKIRDFDFLDWPPLYVSHTPIITLIALLPLLPHLTHLLLSMVFDPVLQGTQASNQEHMQVTLPRLQDLTLVDSFLTGIIFLDHVSFPSSARVRISHIGSMDHSELHYIESIMRDRNHRVESLTSLRTWQLRVRTGIPDGPRLRLPGESTFSVALYQQISRTQSQGNNFINEGENTPDFCLEGQISQRKFETIIPLLDSQQIEVAVLDVRFVDVRTWSHLAHSKSLHTIVFRRTDFGFLITRSDNAWDSEDLFFCTDIAEDASDFFPSLQTIIAEGCDFPPCYSLSVSYPNGYAHLPRENYASDLLTRVEDPTFDRHRLLEFLEIRKEIGYEFNALKLVDCGGLTEEVLHSFSEIEYNCSW